MKKIIAVTVGVLLSVGYAFAGEMAFPQTEEEIAAALSFKNDTVEFEGKQYESTEEGEVFVIVNGQRFRMKGLAGIEETKIVPKAAALITFDSNSAGIKAESNTLLDSYGKVLSSTLAEAKIIIEGHTDSKGPEEYNQLLSQQRSEAVKQYLVAKYNISNDRLIAKGVGEAQPLESNDTEEGRAKNRRVEFVRLVE